MDNTGRDPKNGACGIGGAVLSHDNFVVKAYVLSQNALNGLRNESLAIVGNHQYTELHSTVFAQNGILHLRRPVTFKLKFDGKMHSRG